MSSPPTLLGIPYDRGSSHLRGPAEAPDVIREALQSPATNGWSESGIHVTERLRDAGNLTALDSDHPHSAIEAAVADVIEEGGRSFVLGGDHSITHPILRALRPYYSDLTILQLDAHPDLYDEFEGDRHSHACPFARILEEDLADRLVQVGVRAMNPPQRRQAERFGVDVVSMRDWDDERSLSLSGPVYVSVDVDVLDPAFAPGVSHREPGGLSVRELLTLLHDRSEPIVGADLVEFNPRQDPGGRTASVCAKLVVEIAAQMMDTAPPAPDASASS